MRKRISTTHSTIAGRLLLLMMPSFVIVCLFLFKFLLLFETFLIVFCSFLRVLCSFHFYFQLFILLSSSLFFPSSVSLFVVVDNVSAEA